MASTVTKLFFFIFLLWCDVEACGRRRRRRVPPKEHGYLTKWSPWSSPTSCKGFRTRTRVCIPPRHGGRPCPSYQKIQFLDCDECRNKNGGCNVQRSWCKNTYGSYSCVCKPGYAGSRCDPIKCNTDVLNVQYPKVTTNECRPGKKVVFRHSCIVRCAYGFVSNAITASCKSDRTWSANLDTFTCQRITCQPLRLANGVITPDKCEGEKSPVDRACTFTCNKGFILQGGKKTTKCTSSGIWDSYGHYCKELRCNRLQAPYDGEAIDPKGCLGGYGSICKVKCNHGFTLQGSETRRCIKGVVGNQEVVYWTGTTATCKALRCEWLRPPKFGEIVNPNECTAKFGSTCRLQCNKGYSLHGSTTRVCSKVDQVQNPQKVEWTGSATRCTVKECQMLKPSSAVIVKGTGCNSPKAVYRTVCLHYCKVGYKKVGGSSERVCQDDQTWSGSDIKCVAITCPPLQPPGEALTVVPKGCGSTTSSYKTSCTFKCGAGYRLNGPTVKQCLHTGLWSSGRHPSCSDITPPSFGQTCPSDMLVKAEKGTTARTITFNVPNPTDNSGKKPNIKTFGIPSGAQFKNNQVTYKFKQGQHIIRYIATDGAGNEAECSFKIEVQVIRCEPKLYSSSGGKMQCTLGNIFGSTCKLVCEKGYRLSGDKTRACQVNGKWTGKGSSCEVVRCPKLPLPLNTYMFGCRANSGSSIYGDKCIFRCTRGYKAAGGSSERSCNEIGQWTGDELKCKEIRCKGQAPPTNGKIEPLACKGSPKYDTLCRFSCKTGYKLRGPDINRCLTTGQWSNNQIAVCIDNEPPQFGNSCPQNTNVFADSGKTSKVVTWPPVVATDNSGEKPKVVRTGILAAYREGKHYVTYEATDAAGNKGFCTFTITVRVIRCVPVYAPRNGFFIGECKFIFGSTCNFGCKQGYDIQGSSKRVCQTIGQTTSADWTGTPSRCKVKTCKAIKQPKFGFIVPPDCLENPPYGTTCTIGCLIGFKMKKGSSKTTCKANGEWSTDTNQLATCLDDTPPTFGSTCPGDMVVNMPADKPYATASWDVPLATDNANGKVTIDVSPSGVKPPWRCYNTATIEYIATDASGNKGKCSFKVSLEDNIGPRVVYCPKTILINATRAKETVTWKKPIFSDNSGKALIESCNRKSGSTFQWGTWTIICTAHDNNKANKPAVCKFDVIVKPRKCKDKIPPKNGAMACDEWFFGTFCSPMCKDTWDFSFPLYNPYWVCAANGEWRPPFNWPDCAKLYVPGEARMAGSMLLYFSGDCHSKKTQQQIRNNFINLLKKGPFKDACEGDLSEKCVPENVKVVCGETTNPGKRSYIQDLFNPSRSRRSTQTVSVTFETVVKIDSEMLSSQSNTSKKMKSVSASLLNIVTNLKKELNKTVFSEDFSISVNGQSLLPEKSSLVLSKPVLVCKEGQVIKHRLCVNCAIGSYYNSTTKVCNDCPVGQYQDEEGKSQCKMCPLGTSTLTTRSNNISQCLEFCKPGFYSSTGLEECKPCRKGYYQENSGSKSCEKCPEGRTTAGLSATNVNQCKAVCRPGTCSATGLEPCRECPRNTYQSDAESTSCVNCPPRRITRKRRSTRIEDCIDVNECDSNPCQNGATCEDRIGDYLCLCPEGLTGKNCAIDIDDCASSPCSENATCIDKRNNFTCACRAGFEGRLCAKKVDLCGLNPCKNNGSCDIEDHDVKCTCKAGYTGKFCKTEINECSSSPCQNNGSCNDLINGYTCKCLPGFTGLNCEENINGCLSQPCKNGGTCNDTVNGFSCTCPVGIVGHMCQTDFNECFSDPCTNGGSCLDRPGHYDCVCPDGFSGKRCEQVLNPCKPDPCLNGGLCNKDPKSKRCACKPGYDGVNCENNIDDCRSLPCTNNGTCVDRINGFDCNCSAGYFGKTCEKDLDECLSKPCFHNGTCTDLDNGFLCTCPAGYTGKVCDQNIDECAVQPCLNGGTCVDEIARYKCECGSGFTGINCEVVASPCTSAPCANGATCRVNVSSYTCECPPGFEGKNCETDKDECAVSPCHNNGSCTDQVNGFICDCPAGFNGSMCENDINDCTPNNKCSVNSTCVDGSNSYTCSCFKGYTGTFCDSKILACDSSPCWNNGSCISLTKGYNCLCPVGFSGVNCEVNVDDCKAKPCHNNASCVDGANSFTCVCAKGFTGTLCETKIDFCKGQNCSDKGSCANSPSGFFCKCQPGYFGEVCDKEVNECDSNPCEGDATCTDLVNNFRCNCKAGLTGRFCEGNINECENNRCMNNATCVDHIGSYSCRCAPGYNGTYCEKDIDECLFSPCENGGTCNNTVPGYSCVCPNNYYGSRCELFNDPCVLKPCQNQSTCSLPSKTGDRVCLCAAGFTGDSCNVEIDECVSNPCPTNARCVDKVNGYDCKCVATHTGTNCDIPLNDNFDFLFTKKSSKDFIYLPQQKATGSMEYVTIAFWMKTLKGFNTGTILSYNVPLVKNHLIEVRVISEELQIVFLEWSILTKVIIADGKWHCIGIAWSRPVGTLRLYVDGVLKERYSNVSKHRQLSAGGAVVLGQRHPSISNGILSKKDSFLGYLHQVNIWDIATTDHEMATIASLCKWPIGGTVRAWASFLHGIKGNVQRIVPSRCKATDTCHGECHYFSSCLVKNGVPQCIGCQQGFTGVNCEININECASSPCLHGICEDEINGYSCVCKHGYWGKNCDKKLNVEKACPSLASPMDGHKTCVNKGGIQSCTISCPEPLVFKYGDVTSYECGPDTAFLWNSKKKLHVPSCSSEAVPARIKKRIQINFKPSNCTVIFKKHYLITGSFLHAIREKAASKCLQNGACSISEIVLNYNCSVHAQISANPFSVSFSLTVNRIRSVTNDTGLLFRNLLFEIENIVNAGELKVQVGGTYVAAIRKSVVVVGKKITCDPGYALALSDDACATCNKGEFFSTTNMRCQPCPSGTYQEKKAQLKCIRCPHGKTSPERSISVTACK